MRTFVGLGVGRLVGLFVGESVGRGVGRGVGDLVCAAHSAPRNASVCLIVLMNAWQPRGMAAVQSESLCLGNHRESLRALDSAARADVPATWSAMASAGAWATRSGE